MLAGQGSADPGSAPPACGSAQATSTLAAVDTLTADDIYANELSGTEESFDVSQVTADTQLRAAVATGNAAAARAAVSALVYHPAWHIVRLRVFDATGAILADVGGPYVIAPVSGALVLDGRTVGGFVMSVQDDTGFTKLETRFVGDPIAIYVDGAVVAERHATFPPALPAGSSLELAGTSYRLLEQTYQAFPTADLDGTLGAGTLVAAIVVPPPDAATAALPCPLVRAGEFGRIAERFAALAFALPYHYPGFARTVATFTGADVFVRRGSVHLASSAGDGPAQIPRSGEVTYEGRTWLVFSFEPLPGTTVYVLAPPG
jgi:hypothetical protein